MASPYLRCQALREDGEACWAPALREQHVPDLMLCWTHTAKLLIATVGMPNWAKIRAAERRGAIKLRPIDGLRVAQ